MIFNFLIHFFFLTKNAQLSNIILSYIDDRISPELLSPHILQLSGTHEAKKANFQPVIPTQCTVVDLSSQPLLNHTSRSLSGTTQTAQPGIQGSLLIISDAEVTLFLFRLS